MRIRPGPLCVLLLLVSGAVLGHGGDERGLPHAEQDQIVSYARYIVADRIRRGELPASWEHSEVESAGQIDHQFQREWMVVLRNAKAPQAKQRLYVFFDLEGAYLGANFTGQ